MGREKKAVPGIPPGGHAKARHERERRDNLQDLWKKTPPPELQGKLEKPKLTSKHKSWFEFVENKDKKKKLDFEYTYDTQPPPGFEYVPVGNPDLTNKCKEISRERGAMILIVTPHGRKDELAMHVNRAGIHFRETIVDEARKELAKITPNPESYLDAPQALPETQEEINRQADRAIKDLFPRIPNTDRQMVIDRSFNLSRWTVKEKPPIGLSSDVPLSKRVQLAVLAHIRHIHTRYDQLLREVQAHQRNEQHEPYLEELPPGVKREALRTMARNRARKIIEPICLDFLVKWRGDEETGRDQLDEILCEVIVISDSESDDDDDDDDGDDDDGDDSEEDDELSENPLALGRALSADPGPFPEREKTVPFNPTRLQENGSIRRPRLSRKAKKRARKANKGRQGFSRYQAARDAAWQQAVERQRHEQPGPSLASASAAPMSRSTSHGSRPWFPDKMADVTPRIASGPPRIEVRLQSRDGYRDLDAPTNNREVLNYDDTRQETIPHGERRYQGNKAGKASEYSDERQPIVGSHANMMVERVRHQDRDLKDHLVRSIEPGSPGATSFPSRFSGEPVWQESRDRSNRSMAGSSLPNDEGYAISSSRRPLPRYPVLSANEDFVLLPPRSQASRVHVETGFHPQPIISVTSQSRDFPSTYTPPVSRPSGNYWNPIPMSQSSSGFESRSRPIWIDDEDPLRTRARPIMVRETDQRQFPVATESSRISHSVSGNLDDRPRWNGARLVEQRSGAGPSSQDYVEIVHVTNKFPRRHEPQGIPPGSGGYELRPWTPRQSGQDLAPARVQATGRYHSLSDAAAGRPAGMVAFGNGQRQERVVGHQYVPTTSGPGFRSFTSPVPNMEYNDGFGHPSRPGSVLRDAPPLHQDPRYQSAGNTRHFVREDGVILLN